MLPTAPKDPNPGPAERRTRQHLQSMEQRLINHTTGEVSKVSRAFGSMQAALAQELVSHKASMQDTLTSELNGVKNRNHRVRLVILLSLLLNLVSLAALGILLARVY